MRLSQPDYADTVAEPAAASNKRPIAGRGAGEPELVEVKRRLWRLIREDAAAAEREVEHGPS